MSINMTLPQLSKKLKQKVYLTFLFSSLNLGNYINFFILPKNKQFVNVIKENC